MPPSEFLVLRTFFQIHFAQQPGILEDLIPKMRKINSGAPLPASIKEILNDSSPAIYLLNRLLDPSFHCVIDKKAEKQTKAIEELYNEFKQVSEKFSDEVDLLAMTSAISAFHRHETNYIKVFDYILENSPDNKSSRILIKFLDKKALHVSCPYTEYEEADDADFSEVDLNDVDKDILVRMRQPETLEEIIAKAEAHSSDCLMALYLAACGTLTREDLLLKAPEFLNSNIVSDPVAIGPNDYITESLKDGLKLPDYTNEPHYNYSYKKMPKLIRDKKVTGATKCDELIVNREYACLCYDPGAEKHIDHDKAVSLGYLMGAAEFLHNQDVPLTNFFKACTQLNTGHLHPSIVNSLRDVYDYQCEDIYNLLKAAPSAIPVVSARMNNALFLLQSYYYSTYASAFIRLTAEGVRTFPHAEFIPECLQYVEQHILENGKQNFERLVKAIQPAIDAVNERKELQGTIREDDSLLLNKFSKFYKEYIRKFHPLFFWRPKEPLFYEGLEWPVIYESIISEAVQEFGVPEYDEEIVKYQTPILNGLLVKTLEELAGIQYSETSEIEDAFYHIDLTNNRVDIELKRRPKSTSSTEPN